MTSTHMYDVHHHYIKWNLHFYCCIIVIYNLYQTGLCLRLALVKGLLVGLFTGVSSDVQ